MKVTEFFELFLEELKVNTFLGEYYKFHKSQSSFEFRKSYFCQRLQYIIDNIERKDLKIWDCGCGYGTTDIFLALNGIPVHGTTLEFYYKWIPQRLEFYKKYGDLSLFTFSYENLFDTHPSPSSQDIIIIQDTMHHLEPLDDAISIFKTVLRPGGKLILVEENGNNIIQNFKLYLRRGNKRIIEIHDERLNKKILLGNENIRGLGVWKEAFEKHNFAVKEDKTQYIRLYPPFFYNGKNTEKLLQNEQRIWRTNKLFRENLFFGLNFIVKHKVPV